MSSYPWRTRLEVVDEDLQHLEARIDAFLASRPFSVIHRRENETGPAFRIGKPSLFDSVLPTWSAVAPGRSTVGRSYDIAWYCEIKYQPPERLAHDIGGIVEDLRSCLELIVFALSQKYSGPLTEAQARTVAFPVRLDPVSYFKTDKKGGPTRDSGQYGVRLLDPGAQAVVENLQPFRHQGAQDPLYMLNEFRQQNFHREPLLAVSIGGMTRMGFDCSGADLYIPGDPDRQPAFRTGDEVYRVRITETAPNPWIQFRPQPRYGLAFAPGSAGKGLPVLETLKRLRDHVRDVVFPALEPFT